MRVKKRSDKIFLLGLRAKGVKVYKTKIKPLGFVVAGLGFASLGVAVIPNGFGFVCYPIGFFLLGLVGIEARTYKKMFKDKLRFAIWKLKI